MGAGEPGRKTPAHPVFYGLGGLGLFTLFLTGAFGQGEGSAAAILRLRLRGKLGLCLAFRRARILRCLLGLILGLLGGRGGQ